MARNAVQIFRVAAKGTVEEARRALTETAKREHARVMSTEPKPTRFTREVDGVPGAREEQVKVGGLIRYRYPRIEEVVRFAFDTLFDLSPVLSGEYRNNHVMFVNGAAARNLAEWDGTGEIVITNPLPYSRKIEVGKMKMRVPGSDRVYQQAIQAVRRRFGNQASITFTYRGIVGGQSVNPLDAAPTLKRRTIVRGAKGRFAKGTRTNVISGGQHNRSENRFPAMLIMSRR